MNEPKISFVIVTYNNAATIETCLGSIAARTTDPFEIVVIDNSPDGLTLASIQHFQAAKPALAIRVSRSSENVGFAKACNAGARQAKGEYLFFLNPDTQLWNDAGARLIDCLERHPQALAAGPAIYNGAGEVTRSCRNLPTIGRVILDATGLDAWFGAYKLTRFRHDRPLRVGQVIGAAMLLRRTDYERLGGMDERFFIYFEEVDFCKRIHESGGETWFWPEARVEHLAGRSCEADPVRARMIFTLRASRRKYFLKHFGVRGGITAEIVNRLEGLEKWAVLSALWMLQRKGSHREKAYGFWAVATGVAPRA